MRSNPDRAMRFLPLGHVEPSIGVGGLLKELDARTEVATDREGGDDDAGVHDNHRASRSARTALAAVLEGARPPNATTSAIEELLERGRLRIVGESLEEVLLQRLAGRRGAATECGVDIVGTSLTWMLGMAASLAPSWRYNM